MSLRVPFFASAVSSAPLLQENRIKTTQCHSYKRLLRNAMEDPKAHWKVRSIEDRQVRCWGRTHVAQPSHSCVQEGWLCLKCFRQSSCEHNTKARPITSSWGLNRTA